MELQSKHYDTIMDCLDEFDFEQQIMRCWSVCEDIDTVYSAVMEKDSMTKDDIANALLGLKTIYQLKFEQLFEQFETEIVGNYWNGKRNSHPAEL